MKKIKGFTLIELLAVIVILSTQVLIMLLNHLKQSHIIFKFKQLLNLPKSGH